MLKEEIMDIDEVAPSVNSTEENTTPKSNEFKYKLLDLLEKSDSSLTKSLTLAITIQTMFHNNPEVLERLFQFFVDKKQIEMALDLWENILLKKFELSILDEFNGHLMRIATQVIRHLKSLVRNAKEIETNRESKIDIDPTDEFYLQLFLKLSQASQEKLIIQILDKYRNDFSFLRVNMPDANAKKDQQTPLQSVDIREFYAKLVKAKETIFITKDLLSIYHKFIPEYGLFLIDGFLNIEKQLFANLIQSSSNLPSQTDLILSNIEKRSLNVIRRICVVDLIPEFIYLIEKLDNRHCYRWIEKSLEFFTKYTLNSINAKIDKGEDGYAKHVVKLDYLNVRLLNDIELYAVNEDEKVFNDRIELLNKSLRDLVNYKFEMKGNFNENSPFLHVYKLLDEIGKKLDWPALPANLHNTTFLSVDNKLSYLLNLKNKSASNKSISVSSLNKQISFYGIALFFQKLIEFNSLAGKFFSNNLVMTQKFDSIVKRDFMDSLKPSKLSDEFSEPIDFAVCTLVYCLKLWQKFNNHKEFSTIVTKCLSNSKLDSLTFYKNFLNEYYNVYSLTLNPANNPLVTWSSLSELTNLKQKVSNIVNLFIGEKSSFKIFFDEIMSIFDQLKNVETKSIKSFSNIILSNNQFEVFELNLSNTIQYFSRLIIEKLHTLISSKKLRILEFLSENDVLLGHLILIIQINLTESVPENLLELYDIIFQIIKTKKGFVYPEFFEYVYDVQILSDFLSIISASKEEQNNSLWQLSPESSVDRESIINKFYEQVNSKKECKSDLTRAFFKKNSDSLIDYFNKIFAL